jgi:hypothetical protein
MIAQRLAGTQHSVLCRILEDNWTDCISSVEEVEVRKTIC